MRIPDNSTKDMGKFTQKPVRTGLLQSMIDEQRKHEEGSLAHILNTLNLPLGQTPRNMDGIM
jgi:hypothetical protein